MPLSKRTNARTVWATLFALLAVCVPLLIVGGASGAAVPTVPLGASGSFAVLGSTGITDIPTSSLHGAVGVSPASGATITGLTCAEVTGTIFSVDAAGPLPCRVTDPGRLTTVKNNFTAAYSNAAGRTPDITYAGVDDQLGGNQTLIPGVYRFPSAATANLIGNLTLNGSANSVWIFQATSDFVTAGSSTVTLTGGAQACNVFWQVGTAATLGGASTLVGTVMAGTSITVGTGVTIAGRVMAKALVTLDSDRITRPTCVATPATPPPAPAVTTTAATTTTATTATTTTSTTPTPPTPTATTTTSATPTTPAPAPPKAKPVKKAVVAAAKKTVVKRAAHVPPKPAQHGFGFTG